MRPPGDTSIRCGGKRTHAAEKLDQKPQTDKHERRDSRQKENYEERYQRQDSRTGEEYKISTQYTGDCSARAERRHMRPPGKCRLSHAGSDSADEIENQVHKRSKPVL